MRADLYLSEHGYAPSRERAKRMIESGNVTVDGITIRKSAQEISDGNHAIAVADPLAYVSRGGLKLEAALDAFHVNVNGITALDIGASTGGFTDCLLQRGASRIYAVDAGVGQLAQKLRNDARVISLEHINARNLAPDRIGGECVHLIVMDVSFISATYILPCFPSLLRDAGEAICLIKPQFEVGKDMLGKRGIVTDPSAHLYAIERVVTCADSVGLCPTGLIASPITGGDGNREFLVHLETNPQEHKILTVEDIRAVTTRK